MGTDRPQRNGGSARRYDVVVIGSGVAGAVTALQCAQQGARVALVTKSDLGESTTRFAQGGIAVAQAVDDEPALHLADTLAAGGGLCDESATRVLVEEAAKALSYLTDIGAVFDRSPDGGFALSREGGHALARVVHAGGAATGAEVSRALSAALRRSPVEVFERMFATDLVVARDRCSGVAALDKAGVPTRFVAPCVVLATGGAGQLFAVTTNPPEATGDGVAMALRAGAVVVDVEFVQFHPTALDVESWPLPLLSEALRGAGAVLRNEEGQRFVDELSPRDVVSRAIVAEIARGTSGHVFLDATAVADFAQRFPPLAEIVERAGLDPSTDLLPVVPAVHYLCGGVLTDLDGATSIPGLFAVGEVACTGVEGANRLASNSLLEGMVFGARAARAIASGVDGPSPTGAMRALFGNYRSGALALRMIEPLPNASAPLTSTPPAPPTRDILELRRSLARLMSADAGVVRDEAGLRHAIEALATMSNAIDGVDADPRARGELRNLVDMGTALARAALKRRESRGTHTRSDYPDRDDEHFCCRLTVADPTPRRASSSGEAV